MLEPAQSDEIQFRRIARPDPVKVVAVTSGKGGVGKTNTCVNLAIALAKRGKRVMILDADLGLANVDVLLGLQPPFDLSHVLSDQRTLEEIIVEGPEGIQVVPAASGVLDMVRLTDQEHDILIRSFSSLARDIDVLLVDTAAGIADSVTTLASACQEVIVVACNEPAAITDAYALMKVLSLNYGVRKFQILSNRINNTQEGLTLFNKLAIASDRFLDVSLRYLGGIPEDALVRRSIEQQRAVVDAYPGSTAARAMARIAQVVDRWQPDPAAESTNTFFQNLLGQTVNGGQDN
ncbi:MAG: MinD/ParA family protein [Xanthomonadales bacterium]|nr:MinD/ParA family protein [Xanthomonadales bacterium]